MEQIIQPTLTELMALANIQVITSPGNGSLFNPKDVGTGFLFHHCDNTFFVTARHVVSTTVESNGGEPQDLDNQMAIITNRYRVNEHGLREGELYSIGAFYTFMFFNALQQHPDIGVVEAAFSIVKPEMLREMRILTAGVKNYATGETIVEGGCGKIIIDSDSIVNPNGEDVYYLSGFVQVHWEESPTSEKILAYGYIFHNEMKFSRMDGDFIVLESPELASKKEWSGLSGAPVFNQ